MSQVLYFSNFTGTAQKVFIRGVRTRLYADNQPSPNHDVVFHINYNTGVSAGYPTLGDNNNAVMTPDGSKIIAWNSNSQVFVYDTSGAGLPHMLTINHAFTPTPSLTTNIAVSADSSLAIIETDVVLPLLVVSLSDGSLV